MALYSLCFTYSGQFGFQLGAALPKTISSFARNLHIYLMSDVWVKSSQRNKQEKKKTRQKKKKAMCVWIVIWLIVDSFV